jgi:5'-nucleotidase / UDP-sugar diphosphatase
MAAGDNFTGNPVVDQYYDKGFPIIELMNLTGFNASAIGNHEFDYGQETLLKRIQQAQFPFLSANIKDESGKCMFKPYTIIKLDNDIEVAILSAIQLGTDGIPDSHPSNMKGLIFKDGVEELVKYSNLRDSCEVFVALTHLGFQKDLELAQTIPSLDLIFGGHTHTLTKPVHMENNIPVIQAGSGVKYLAKATVCVVDSRVVKIIPEMLNVNSYSGKDEAIATMIERFNDNPELNKEIGTTTFGINGENELGSMMTDAIVNLEQVDIAFQNNGGIRLDNITAGPVTVKDIYKLDPFGNEIILFKMSAEEIKSLILNSYEKGENSVDLQVSGLTYTIITDENKKAKDVTIKLGSGKKLKKNKHYNVGINSYIASSYKFDHRDPGKSLYMTTAQALIQFITEKKTIDYKGVKRAFSK